MPGKTILIVAFSALLPLALWSQDLPEVQPDTLNAAVVEADEAVRRAVTQTSLKRIEASDIARGYATFGTPDLIKILQQLPGVASGTELMSGLYVRGGDGSDNLYLLDGVPMYQVSHLIGLFSSFNTDMVEGVDFYKGGFPARFGGRLSSVVDVGIREGGYDAWHGSASLGITDGRLQFGGPIVKGRTSLNVGIRRTWTDIIKSAAMPFINDPLSEEMTRDSNYDFTDFNLKLTHRLAPGSKLILSAYYGHDLADALIVMEEGDTQSSTDMDLRFRLRWGNTLGSLRWEHRWNENLLMDAQIFHTRYSSDMRFITDIFNSYRSEGESLAVGSSSGTSGSSSVHLDEHNLSRVYDTGAFLHFYWGKYSRHNLRFGTEAVLHTYDPSRSANMLFKNNGEEALSDDSSQSKNYRGADISIFGEDEISFTDRFKMNLGLRGSLYLVGGTAYPRLEPRLSTRFIVTDKLALKASYSAMNQFTHLVAATYLDLPTNLWMPSTSKIRPMHADQGVLGAEYSFSRNLSLDVECFGKYMTHIYEYTGVNSMLPQIDEWESVFSEGRGRAYGAEFSLEYRRTNCQAALYYTLSKSERLFPAAYFDWYPDRNDNLHRLTLTASWRFSRKFELYGGWTFHTGNRFTGKTAVVWDDNYVKYEIYDSPNSFSLPAYHRLDLGFNWHHKTRRGGERTFNISVYNAYCHVNAMFGFIEESEGRLKGMAYGLIPIVPSISYYWKF